MHKFDRIVHLHAIFSSRRTAIPLADLMAKLECSKCTLHRTINALKDYLNAPVVFDAEAGGYKYAKDAAGETYELPGLWFTPRERQASAVLQRHLERCDRRIAQGASRAVGETAQRTRDASTVESWGTGKSAAVAVEYPRVLGGRNVRFRPDGHASCRTVLPQAWDDDQNGMRTVCCSNLAATSLTHGDAPLVISSSSRSDERKALLEALHSFEEADIEPRNTCVVLRTNDEVSEYAEWLASEGLGVLPLTRDVSDDDARPGIRVATMHRVKGLEFDAVIIAGYRGPQKYAELFADDGDAGVLVDMLTNERCLLHVAATRAKRALVVSQIEN